MFSKILSILAAIVISTTVLYANGQEQNYEVEIIAENLKVPWQIAFAPDDRIFFTERGGQLRVIQDGELLNEPMKVLEVGAVEGGLLGIALDKNFEENHFVYLYYTYTDFVFTYNRVSKFVEKDNDLTEEQILIDKIPGGPIHDGGRIKFGPDNKLYITTGEAGNPGLAQDLDSLGGKILRINSDGTIPKDNPFEESPIFSYGHRNPQGLDWDPITQKLVITEHGPSGERGFAHDEINIIKRGNNYGWPTIVGDETKHGLENPLVHSGDETWAPSGATFYNSDNISEWENKFLVANLRGAHLRVFDLDLSKEKVESSEELFKGQFGRLREAAIGPDGNLYLLTSNKDGRGNPDQNDDKIIRIAPAKVVPFDPPLVQIKKGIEPKDVSCDSDKKLLFKKTDGKPVCVFHSTAQKLLNRNWAITAG